MSDYSKLTVPKLRELLTSRGLPTNGLKVELIARLQAADNEGSSTPAAPVEAPTPAEPVASSTPAEATPAAEAAPANPAPAKKSIAALFDAPAAPATETAPAAAAAAPAEATTQAATTEAAPAVEEPKFTAGLATTTLDEEIARRKKRAERFGLSAQDAEALKTLERQKRFGIQASGEEVKGLDTALPERERRSKPQAGRGGRGGHRGHGGRGGPRRNGPPRNDGVQGARVSKPAPAVNPEDKRKAEERKKRFAT
ncbi:putative SAP domain protein [Pyronema omphalodes]|nr:putative SAP domain protein [Pyronema omphalodes]